MNYDLAIALASIFCLIIVSAFFSGTETGLTTASRARLTELERRGNKRASSVLKLTSNPERLIGALLHARPRVPLRDVDFLGIQIGNVIEKFQLHQQGPAHAPVVDQLA